MKKICWVTPDYFADCDIVVIPQLLTEFRIHWTVLLPVGKSRFQPEEFDHLKGLQNLTLNIMWVKYRLREVRSFAFYLKLFKGINQQSPDLIYINHAAAPFFAAAAILSFNPGKTIYTAHQGDVHGGFDFKLAFKVAYRLLYSRFRYINLFSESQAGIFRRIYSNKRTYVIPLAQKDLGQSDKVQLTDQVHFFNVGNIKPLKNIHLLIDAACSMYEKGMRGFHVHIAGQCDNWDFYQKRIKYPELFTCTIRLLQNNEIADMFAQYHYLVLPYGLSTQSGPLKLALNYNVPIVASDIDTFKADVHNGIDGYLFESDNVQDLEHILTTALQQHESHYQALKAAQRQYAESQYSGSAIAGQYRRMFNGVLGQQ